MSWHCCFLYCWHCCHFFKKNLKKFFLTFIDSTTNQNPIEKANMFLSKEATNKDQSLKMQMILSLDKSDSSNSEKFGKNPIFLVIKKVILQSQNPFQRISWFIVTKVQLQLEKLKTMQFILTMPYLDKSYWQVIVQTSIIII